MKLRYLMLALLTLTTATALTAQTMTASNVAAKTRTARNVIKDVRNKKIDAEIRRNPMAFATKHEKTVRELKKHRPKWLGGKSKKRTTRKK